VADLFIREIQPHEIEAEDPDSQRLVMAGEDGPGQVVEVLPTVSASVHDPNAITELRATVVIPFASTKRSVISRKGQP
jgi:hypothetical protein